MTKLTTKHAIKLLILGLIVVFVGGILLFTNPTNANAQTSITVSLDISDTILRINGLTSPNAHITFIENNAVIGTTQANQQGEYSKDITYPGDGIHTVSFYATNQKGITTSTITITVAVYTHAITTVDNILIPPTIEIDDSVHTTNPNENIIFSGTSAPNTTITLVTGDLSKQTTTNTQGNWQIAFTGDQFLVGTHTAVAKAQTTSGILSENSEVVTFKINEYIPPEPEPEPKPEEPAETHPESPTQPEDKNIIEKIIDFIKQDEEPQSDCNIHEYLENFDYNGNCFIPKQTVEFVTAVTYWTKNWKEVSNAVVNYLKGSPDIKKDLENLTPEEKQKIQEEVAKCDLNNDLICNLKDFSILLYYTNNENPEVKGTTQDNKNNTEIKLDETNQKSTNN